MSQFDEGKLPDNYVADEFGQTGKMYFKRPKFKENPEVMKSIEFQRYKQDCRKRALDLAHSERENRQVNVPLNQQQSIPGLLSAEKVLEKADKYYNWLIDI